MDVTRELDGLLVGLTRRARLLPALVAENAASERARLLGALERGEALEPRWVFRREAPTRSSFAALDAALDRAAQVGGVLGEAYRERLEEIARMLAGEQITDAARENARAMLGR